MPLAKYRSLNSNENFCPVGCVRVLSSAHRSCHIRMKNPVKYSSSRTANTHIKWLFCPLMLYMYMFKTVRTKLPETLFKLLWLIFTMAKSRQLHGVINWLPMRWLFILDHLPDLIVFVWISTFMRCFSCINKWFSCDLYIHTCLFAGFLWRMLMIWWCVW